MMWGKGLYFIEDDLATFDVWIAWSLAQVIERWLPIWS